MIMYRGGWEYNPCWSLQYLKNHSSVHDHKPSTYECIEPKKNSDRHEELQQEVCGKRKISVAVLNSSESHWMWRGEKDVEQSCNNRKSKSRGHKS